MTSEGRMATPAAPTSMYALYAQYVRYQIGWSLMRYPGWLPRWRSMYSLGSRIANP